MEQVARGKLSELGLMTIQNINQAVETLSGGQRQGVAVARAAAFGSKVIILDEPTAALGVKESRRVLELILDVRSRGIPIILISHNMPHVFEASWQTSVCDRSERLHYVGRRGVYDGGEGSAGLISIRLESLCANLRKTGHWRRRSEMALRPALQTPCGKFPNENFSDLGSHNRHCKY